MYRLAWLVLLGITIASCSDSGNAPAAPSPSTTVQPTSVSTLTSLTNPDSRIFNVTDADSANGRGPCEFNASTGQFECPPQSRDGITFTMQFTLFDANGNVQSKMDRTTASIRTETTAEGTTTRENGAVVTINRSGVMTTTGLGPDAKTHTLNGREQGTVVATITANDGTKVTTTTSIDDTTANLVVPVRSADRATAYPLSGTRTHTTITTGPAGRGALTVRRQETFDGTNIVRVEITVNGVTQSCTFDLATKTSTCQRPDR
jgi:hypothetical protein